MSFILKSIQYNKKGYFEKYDISIISPDERSSHRSMNQMFSTLYTVSLEYNEDPHNAKKIIVKCVGPFSKCISNFFVAF